MTHLSRSMSVVLAIVLFPWSQCFCQEPLEFPGHVREAVARLRNEEFYNRVIQFQSEYIFDWCGKRELVSVGTGAYCCFEHNYCSDLSTTTKPYFSNSSNRMMAGGPRAYQYVKLQNQKLLGVPFKVDGKGRKQAERLLCEPSADHRLQMLSLTGNIKLEFLFFAFTELGISIGQLADYKPDFVVALDDGALKGDYMTEYGRMQITLVKNRGKFYLQQATLQQARSDRYTSLGKDRLKNIPDSGLGDLANGLDSASSAFTLVRDFSQAAPTISQIVGLKQQSAGEKNYVSTYTKKVTSIQPVLSLEDFDKHHVPIPEGMRVHALDPGFESLTLTHRNGEIVREVDGASLDQVVVENRNSKLRWKVLSIAAGVLVFGLAGWYLVLRRVVRRRRSADGVTQ